MKTNLGHMTARQIIRAAYDSCRITNGQHIMCLILLRERGEETALESLKHFKAENKLSTLNNSGENGGEK